LFSVLNRNVDFAWRFRKSGDHVEQTNLSDTVVRWLRPVPATRRVTHVIFDFDGTLSWLRHGWPEIMLRIFRARLPRLPGESETEAASKLLEGILALNGKPTIHQMIYFEREARARGGTPPSAEALLKEYTDELHEAIQRRCEKIRSGAVARDHYVIAGARPLLEELRRRSLTLVILSGTLEELVKQEAALLGLSEFFGGHIYGSTPDPHQFSKKQVIERLIETERIHGANLVSFGDGPMEIVSTKEVGGIAIGVASHEERNGCGEMDSGKAVVLREAGADALISDYRCAPEFLFLFDT
jgi:phosphoglycolate phosphatase